MHILLSVENTIKAWKFIEPLVNKVVVISKTHSSEDVKRLLVDNSCQLWVEFEEGIKSIVVTEVIQYPQKRRLRIWIASAVDEKKANWQGYEEIITKFAKEKDCKEIETIGRIGWGRIFKSAEKMRQEFVYSIGE